MVAQFFVANAFALLLKTVSIGSTRLVRNHAEFANIQYLSVAYTDSEVVEVCA